MPTITTIRRTAKAPGSSACHGTSALAGLKLELSPGKTLITHARTQAARFLGYEITVLHNDRKVTRGIRRANGTVSPERELSNEADLNTAWRAEIQDQPSYEPEPDGLEATAEI